MEEKIKVECVFQLIEGDDDILLIDKDAFTSARLKELLIEDFQQKAQQIIAIYDKNIPIERTNFNTNVPHFLNSLKAGHKTIDRTELIWQSILDCQFLKIGSKGWEKGKLRIQVIDQGKTKVSLEFSPDEPPQPESPLDDLRELPEYKQQA
jgi:hypothetical protein